MKLTSSPKQEKIFSLNINQSNKSQLEKLNYLYPSIPKEGRNLCLLCLEFLINVLKLNFKKTIEIIKYQITVFSMVMSGIKNPYFC